MQLVVFSVFTEDDLAWNLLGGRLVSVREDDAVYRAKLGAE